MNDFTVERELTHPHVRYVAVRVGDWLYRATAFRLPADIAREQGGPWKVTVEAPFRTHHNFQGSDGLPLLSAYVAEKLLPRVPEFEPEQVDGLTRTVGVALHRSYLLGEP